MMRTLFNPCLGCKKPARKPELLCGDCARAIEAKEDLDHRFRNDGVDFDSLLEEAPCQPS